MRLSETQVQLICQKLLHSLRAKQLIELNTGESEILSKMKEIFIKDLRVEDKINEEAERLLAQVVAASSEDIDQEKMFQMIKKELIKKKNVVL